MAIVGRLASRTLGSRVQTRLSHSLVVPYNHNPVTPFENGVPKNLVRPLSQEEKKWDFWTSSEAFHAAKPKSRGFAHVPYGEVWVVERFGKFSRALPAGVHLLIPGVDSVKAVKNAHTVSMGVTTSSVKAKDGSLANGYAVLYFNVTDYEQSAYYVDLETGRPDSERALAKLVRSVLEKQLATAASARLTDAETSAFKDAALKAIKREESDMGLQVVDLEFRGVFPENSLVPDKLRAMDPPPLNPEAPGHNLRADYWQDVMTPPFFNKFKFGSMKEAEPANAGTLEWSIPSPPDYHHFNQLPRMTVDPEEMKALEGKK